MTEEEKEDLFNNYFERLKLSLDKQNLLCGFKVKEYKRELIEIKNSIKEFKVRFAYFLNDLQRIENQFNYLFHNIDEDIGDKSILNDFKEILTEEDER
jgi:hypothetical protein